MLELRIINAGQTFPLFDLPMHLGRARAAREIGDTIEGMIAFLDDLGGDLDLEDGGDDEPSGDEADASWTEGPNDLRKGFSFSEDDEACGDETDGDFAEDEEAAYFSRVKAGPGCMISDPDKGGEEDGEMQDGE